MIAFLHGRLAQHDESSATIECGGVGYRVLLAPSTRAQLPALGETLRLPTWLAVRDDALTLYGFASEDERSLFELTLTVAGVGPKVGQSLVTTLGPARLVEALRSGDEALLATVTGVGKKLAQRLVVELAEKVGVERVLSGGSGPAAATPVGAEVREALASLGFTAHEARRLADGAAERVGADQPLEVILREALRLAGSGG